MKFFKSFIGRIVLVLVMALMLGILGHNNVYAQGDDPYTKILLHMDDSNFTDESGHVVTNSGASLNNSIYKFGSGSTSFNGSSSYLKINAGTTDLDVGAGDFTVDFWMNYQGSQNTLSQIFQNSTSKTWTTDCVAIHQTSIGNSNYPNRIAFWVNNYKNNDPLLLSKTTLLDNKWYHVAIVRSNSVCKLYINGICESTATYAGNINFCVDTNGFVLGAGLWQLSTTGYYKGYLDEFRISNIARWASDFTPPTESYLSVNGISLNKKTDSITIDNSDQLVVTITPDNATNKTVTWKSSDESIATVDATGKVTAHKEGTATITATTQDGSNLSASCVVTAKPKDTTPTNPTQPTDSNGNAILTITMTNGNIKSYTVSMIKVNDFISWYNNRASGSNGNPYYSFDKTDTLQPFTKKTEHIVFDKISSFEVDEYDKK